MANCTVCAAPLDDSLAMFGPDYAPLCVSCWLNAEIVTCPHCNGFGIMDDPGGAWHHASYDGNICPFCLGEQYVTADVLDYIDYDQDEDNEDE